MVTARRDPLPSPQLDSKSTLDAGDAATQPWQISCVVVGSLVSESLSLLGFFGLWRAVRASGRPEA
jgi:hypothetical protein